MLHEYYETLSFTLPLAYHCRPSLCLTRRLLGIHDRNSLSRRRKGGEADYPLYDSSIIR